MLDIRNQKEEKKEYLCWMSSWTRLLNMTVGGASFVWYDERDRGDSVIVEVPDITESNIFVRFVEGMEWVVGRSTRPPLTGCLFWICFRRLTKIGRNHPCLWRLQPILGVNSPGNSMAKPVQAQVISTSDRVLSGRLCRLNNFCETKRCEESLYRVMPNVAVLVMGPAGAGKVLMFVDCIWCFSQHSVLRSWTRSLNRNGELRMSI
jgi:hypothetical protein